MASPSNFNAQNHPERRRMSQVRGARAQTLDMWQPTGVYSQTSIKPPPINFPKFASHIYCKFDLY